METKPWPLGVMVLVLVEVVVAVFAMDECMVLVVVFWGRIHGGGGDEGGGV